MTDVVTFLLARIAEDETLAKRVIAERQAASWAPGMEPEEPDLDIWVDVDGHTPHVAVGAERVLAECAAKRGIAEECLAAIGRGESTWLASRVVLPLLARPYAGHPDYQSEWA